MAVQSIEELKPVYLIFGDEELLLERALHRLRERVAQVADLDFNFQAFDGEHSDPYEIIGAANTLPFASERRLVVVRGVDRMPASDQGILAEYATDPAETACLVLVAQKLRKDSKLYKAVHAIGGAAEYTAPRKGEYPTWVAKDLAARGRYIEPDAAALLVRAVGRDLRRLETEIGKIVAYVGDRTEISRADVESVVALSAPPSIFDFLNAMSARECGTALGLLEQIIDGGEEMLKIHAMTVRHLRTLVSVRALIDRGVDRGGLMREVGMADWQARQAAEQARRFEPAELRTALGAAAELEARMKSGRGEPRYEFEVWLIDLCSPSR